MAFTYKELIEVAIGSPESGHVNFYALQILLTCFAQRLEVLDQAVVQDDYMMTNGRFQRSLMNLAKSRMSRVPAGADAEEQAPADPAAEAPAEDAAPLAEATPKRVPSVDEATETQVEEVVPSIAPVEEAPPNATVEEAPPIEEVVADNATQMSTEVDTEAEKKAQSSQQTQEEGISQTEQELCSEDKLMPVASQISRTTTREKTSFTSMLSNFTRLNTRVSKIELIEREHDHVEIKNQVTNLTGQMKVVMQSLDTVSHMMIDERRDSERVSVLRYCVKQLRVLMGVADGEVSVGSSSNEAVEDEGELDHHSVEEMLEECSVSTEKEQSTEEHDVEMGLKTQIFYSPSRILAELLDYKAQFCLLTNKVNDLSAAFLKQDTQRLLGMITDLQATVHEFGRYMISNKEFTADTINRINALNSQVNMLKKSTEHLDSVKTDWKELELLLAEKVNFQQLATKVSLEQLEDYKGSLESMFCELRNIIVLNERNVLQIIEHLRMTLGIDAMELSFRDFREFIERKVLMIGDTVQKYMEMTNDDCATAVGKVKVMPDLACLSCDTNCVMRTMEHSKVPSLPALKGSTGLGPMLTYELAQIRKSGVMGYFRKDEFPHSSSAWTKGKSMTRQAGGTHTIHTAEEHLQKVKLSKKSMA